MAINGRDRWRMSIVRSPEGGFTRHWPDGDQTTIFDAAERYIAGAQDSTRRAAALSSRPRPE